MPRETDKLLYDKAVQWINENPHSKRISKKTKQDFLLFDALSSEKKSQLINTLLKMTELPEVMKHSLPWLTGSMEILPTEVIQMIGVYLNEPERKNLACTSKRHEFRTFIKMIKIRGINNRDKLVKDVASSMYKGVV